MKALYTASATAKGGRNGEVVSSDNVLNLQVRMPRELGGSGGAYTNPEQLFAAGYSACFDSALNLVARMQKLPMTSSTVTAEVTIGSIEGGRFGLEATLRVKTEGLDYETSKKLVEAAHQVCPYSNATRNNMNVTLIVEE